MKITRIQVDNFLGARSVDAVLNTPIALFCGPNAAGKSSIQEAVRMAIAGEVVRVNLKKEYGQLVAEGAKAGGGLITTEAGAYSFDVPGGKSSIDTDLPTGDSIALALNGQRFASMKPDERRTFLFDLTGLRANIADVKDRLIARKCDEAKIEAVLPMIRTGFPSGNEYATNQATQSKRLWREVTGGSAYGAKVAERWEAEKPVAPEKITVPEGGVAALDEEIAKLNRDIGAAAADIRTANENAAKREQMKAKADSVDRIRETLELKRTELAAYEPEVITMRERASGTARVGLIHDMAMFLLDATLIPDDAETANNLLERYEEEHGELTRGGVDQDAKASLPEYERGLEVMQNAVKNLERDLEQAIAAKTAYDALKPADGAKSSAGDLDAMQAGLLKLKAERDELAAGIRANEQYAAALAAVKTRTDKAAAHHADVVTWLAIADALAPDGIPGELLAEALKPLNSTLQMAGVDTKWPSVYISPEMDITAGKRAYGLLSESEQWRVDAMIAQSIAKISGHKILMLDRMDVLDLPGRSQLLGWLDMLADDGVIDTALLFATLKGMPTNLPATITPFWIKDGAIAEFKAAA